MCGSWRSGCADRGCSSGPDPETEHPIITMVRFIVDGSSDYPDIAEVAGVARKVAVKVLSKDASQGQCMPSFAVLPGFFALP